MCVVGDLEGQWFALRTLPIRVDRDDKVLEGILPVPNGFANSVFNQPAFQVDCLFGRWRQLHPGGILEDPT